MSAIKHFVAEGYEVFTPLTDNAECDLIVLNDEVKRVEVKSTTQESSKSWIVGLKGTRPNKTRNAIHNFDASKSELLVVYVVPEDKIYVFDSKDYDGRSSMTIKKT